MFVLVGAAFLSTLRLECAARLSFFVFFWCFKIFSLLFLFRLCRFFVAAVCCHAGVCPLRAVQYLQFAKPRLRQPLDEVTF